MAPTLKQQMSRARTAATTAMLVRATRRNDPSGLALARRIRTEGLTLLSLRALLELRQRVREIEAAGVSGSVIEAGCALGGSALMIAASKVPDRPMYVFDVFGTIPPPSDKDGPDVHQRFRAIAEGRAVGPHGKTYYGYEPNLKAKVVQVFERFDLAPGEHSVELIEGLFQDTVRPESAVAFAHIDGDWYESVKACLDRIWPHLSPGGVIVIDDYDAWSGCRRAVDEFIASRKDVDVERRARLHLVKNDGWWRPIPGVKGRRA